MQTCLTGRLGRARRRFLGNILLCPLALCCVAPVHAQQSAGAVADTTANAPSKSQAKPSQSGYTGLVFGVKATRTAANTFVADYPTVGHVDPGSPAAKAGIMRINCAHDDQDAWARMIEGLDGAAKKTGRRMKVLMDLAGPKIRTGAIRESGGPKRIAVGDEFAIMAPGELGAAGDGLAAIECTQIGRAHV